MSAPQIIDNQVNERNNQRETFMLFLNWILLNMPYHSSEEKRVEKDFDVQIRFWLYTPVRIEDRRWLIRESYLHDPFYSSVDFGFFSSFSMIQRSYRLPSG
jgi:hypothetical protein